LFRVAVQSNRTLYPTAYSTLLRTALMGGAQAAWVLKPPTQVERRLYDLGCQPSEN
jgi:hypothetical protein